MILKMLDYEKSKNGSYEVESWTYFDNIDTARTTFDEDAQETVVSCTFKGESGVTTFTVKHLAYLMSDAGKTIDRITAAVRTDSTEDEPGVYDTLQKAAAAAINA